MGVAVIVVVIVAAKTQIYKSQCMSIRSSVSVIKLKFHLIPSLILKARISDTL